MKNKITCLSAFTCLLVCVFAANAADDGPSLMSFVNYHDQAVEDGRHSDAQYAAKRAYDLAQNETVDPVLLSRIRANYANTLLDTIPQGPDLAAVQQVYTQALDMLEEELDFREEHFGKEAEELIDIHRFLGNAYVRLNERGKADRNYKKSVSIGSKLGYEPLRLGDLNMSVANWLTRSGYQDFSDLYLKNASKEYQKVKQGDAALLAAGAEYQLANVELMQANSAKAEKVAARALELLSEDQRESEIYFQLNRLLAGIHHREEEPEEALEYVTNIIGHPSANGDIVLVPFEAKMAVLPQGTSFQGLEAPSLVALFTVAENGEISNIIFPQRNAPDSLKRAATLALESARYVPGNINGKVVSTDNVRKEFYAFPNFGGGFGGGFGGF